ncbi:MAG: SH3 domain-containing protein [Xanthobacteraceae bacterium]
MRTMLKLASALLLLGLAPGQASAQSREFFCTDKSSVTIKVIDAKTVSVGKLQGKTIALKQNPKSPRTFVSSKAAVAIAKDEKSIRLRQAGADDMTCVFPKPAGQKTKSPQVASDDTVKAGKPKSAATKFKAFKGQSWGGIVRAGPGQEFDKLASLKEGDPITVIEQSKEMDDYFWYKIRYGKQNRTGYQWGGIICAVGQTVQGALGQCDD